MVKDLNNNRAYVLLTVKALEEYKVMQGDKYICAITKISDDLWLVIRPERKAIKAASLRIAYQTAQNLA